MNQAPDWLSLTQEETIDPALAICDPHHHLWRNRPNSLPSTYLLDDFLSDIHTGEHNIVSSVFIECGTMFSADGPVDLRPVGETQFASDMAAMSASGLYGPTRVAAGIVGTAFLSAGDSVASVLDAQLEQGETASRAFVWRPQGMMTLQCLITGPVRVKACTRTKCFKRDLPIWHRAT
tara:strand:- start:32 stop:565 length:534 start_codon:yes stop_codon:yes gene_type:complete